MNKVIKGFVLSLALVAILGFAATAMAKTKVLKINSTAPKDHYIGKAIDSLAEAVKKASNGELEIQHFPSSQLGGERESLEALKLGTLHMSTASDGIMGAFVPDWKILSMPFLIQDLAQYKKLLASPLGKQLFQSTEKYGFKVLESRIIAFRYPTNNIRPITTPASFKGLKMRTQENPVQMKMMKALGASATAVPWPELYTALQTGLVEGQMNEYGAIHLRKFWEVQNYVTEMPTLPASSQILISNRVWAGLSPAHQKIIQQAVTNAFDSVEKQSGAQEDGFKQAIIATNQIKLNVLPKDQYPAFVKALQPVYAYVLKTAPTVKSYYDFLMEQK